CCIVRERAGELVPVFVDAVERAAGERASSARIHATPDASTFLPERLHDARVVVRRADGEHDEPAVTPIDVEGLGTEWEWESSPEVSLHVVDTVDEAVRCATR
ncbi:MAG: glutamate-5-semialdehyde dehydrogenase, partial [Ilumatobacter sp.]|nr:glutamate-5-semialdehyde dehydrogenase [Ilumatobacter sp.]